MSQKFEFASGKELKRKKYEKELRKLQARLCQLQEWVKYKGLRVIIVFEGRDAAGKDGAIRAITERVSPRVFRIVALPAPSSREKSQMYVQRYIAHSPAAGEIAIFDRSWYDRAGVEYVMGFCTKEDHTRFLEICPKIERYIVDELIKIWLEVSDQEQKRRFEARINDPLRQWKLSPVDLASHGKWFEYSRARPHVQSDGYEVGPLAHRSIRRQEARSTQLHRSHFDLYPVQESAAAESQAAQAFDERRV